MLAETLSSVEAKDRDLGSVVAKDHPRYDGAGLNINRRGDLRKRYVWHPARLLCSPPGGISSRIGCWAKGHLRHRADGRHEARLDLVNTDGRRGLEHAWPGGKGQSNPAQQVGPASPCSYPCVWQVADTHLVHDDRSRALVGDRNSIEKQITEVDTLRHRSGTGREVRLISAILARWTS